ncbi:Gfo/Idh/MocA family protein [Anaeromyxobacter oryzae]|uniref:Oxidoreductase n=1 Tax=Anaeromyxobacter oryzae TaxID=2918170 RepID=A0ABM7X0S1_9BACT|nr:Gfo/Idh/MocA family oxidoreductase [Anaeromyxobacter oryzae]BDG05399.1 oxidoreductase [Anaeromyxobacter oryzae]
MTDGSPRRLRLGMVGGGPGSTIGETHRHAARFDGRYALVAGVFASDPARSRAFAATLDVPPDRRYGSWEEMAEAEAARRDGVEVVAIMTPNASHHPIARAFLDRGVDVICDKPLAVDLEQALDLLAASRRAGVVLAVTYNYTGYPMVRHARELVRAGELGTVRLVQVEHASGWAATLLEAAGHKQAAWRTTPALAGKSTVVGDLGTHAHHLARFVTGLEITALSAELSTVVPGRASDDNAHVKLRFSNGARGMMWACMAATGHLHGLRLRVYGDQASLEWIQEQPDQLVVRPLDGPHRILSRGAGYLSAPARRVSRLWPGHPEGFLEAFANVYTDVADAVIARRDGGAAPDPGLAPFPTVEDGVLGVKFVEAAVESSRRDGAWVDATLDLGRPGA